MNYQLTARQTVFFLETFNHTKTTGPNLLKDHRLSTPKNIKKKIIFKRKKKDSLIFFMLKKILLFQRNTISKA